MKLILLSLLVIYSQLIVNRIEAQKCENEILINNVKVPSTFDLVGLGFGLGFTPGKSIQFVGTIKSGSSCIKLANPGEILKDADVVFHFSPRPGLLGLLKHIERNSWSKRTGWTPVDSSGGWPIKPNNNFEMEWIAGPNNAINVYIDKKFFTTYKQWDTSKVAQLNIVDAIAISSIKLCGGKPDPTPPPPRCENPILIDKVPIPSTFDLVKLGFGLGFTPGKSIQFVGTIKSGSSCIKLAEPGELFKDGAIVFHFSPRPGLFKHIERNSWSKATGWTPVDSSGGWPIKPNNNFEMEWIAGPNNAINVYIDKKFFTTYNKWDTSKVAQLNIVDAIAISSIKLCGGKPDPTPTPPPKCPNEVLITNVSIGNINLIKYGFGKGFTVGKSIIMTGTFLNGGSCIKLADPGAIALTANVPAHFANDPTKKLQRFNSWIKGKGWTPEDRTGGYPFKANNQFVMEWSAENRTAIRVIVDGKFWKLFSREDLSNIEQLDFSYFIRISSVKLCRQEIETTTPEIPTTTPSPPTCPNEVLITNVSIGNVNLLNYGFGIGFTEGKSIIMTGKLLNGGSCIKLGDPGVLLVTANAVFHFSPNNVAKHVICNSWMKGKGWTPEDKSGGYPFNPNNQFELQWIAEPNNTVKIYVDRKFFRTFSREDLSKVVQIDFSYAIRISSIKLCREEIETTTPEIPTTTPPPPTCPNEVLITNVSIGNINLIKYGFGKGFTVGKSIIMTGTFLNGGSCIKLADAGVITVTGNVPFHFATDPTKKITICNSWIKGKGWTPEDRTGGYPFNPNNKFVMEWISEPGNTIKIIVDGKFWKRFSREDLSNIEQLDFSYAIRISSVKLCRLEIETTTPTIPTPPPKCPNEVLITNVSIGNVNLLKYGFGIGFTVGKSIIMTGKLLNGGSCIKLGEEGVLLQTANAVFHFSPDNVAKHVICNSWMKGKGWTPEDKSGGYPFNPNNLFELEWVAEPNNTVKINVDRIFWKRFSREDLSGVVQLDFSYAIRISSIKLCRADEIPTTTTTVTPTTPPPDVPCPYFSLKLDLEIPIAINLENGFKPGKHITIIGTPTDYFPDFVVGLGEPGIMRETANVLFSFSPQLNSKSVTVNTLLTGIGWETELTYGHSPFKVGEPFVLEIKAGLNNQIEVFVNYSAYLRFTRHDLSKVSQIQIIRAVKVCSIVTCY